MIRISICVMTLPLPPPKKQTKQKTKHFAGVSKYIEYEWTENVWKTKGQQKKKGWYFFLKSNVKILKSCGLSSLYFLLLLMGTDNRFYEIIYSKIKSGSPTKNFKTIAKTMHIQKEQIYAALCLIKSNYMLSSEIVFNQPQSWVLNFVSSSVLTHIRVFQNGHLSEVFLFKKIRT